MRDDDAALRGDKARTVGGVLGSREGAPIAMTRLFVSIDALFSQLRRRLDLGPNERLAMEYLWEYGPMPMSDLADRLAVTRAAVTTLVDRMATMGLVTRQSDMQDRRRTIVTVSDAGIERCCRAVQPWHEAVRDLTEVLTDEEWGTVAPLLGKLHEATRAEADRQRRLTDQI